MADQTAKLWCVKNHGSLTYRVHMTRREAVVFECYNHDMELKRSERFFETHKDERKEVWDAIRKKYDLRIVRVRIVAVQQ